jgi:hypothetical protein
MAGAAVVVDVDELQAAYERAEQHCDEAAEAERVAFDKWQAALGAYEVARDESDQAWRAYSSGVAAA